MKLFVLLLLNVGILTACTNKSINRDIKNNLKKTVNLDMFDTVRQRNDLMPLNDFRKMYRYISIVYLEDGCNPCYSKFIDWQKMMIAINKRNDYTVLFIINGFTYNQFINKVTEVENIEDQYYTIIDKDFKYLLNNNEIPRWIIDESLLIDNENKIRMIGQPWSTREMTNLFYNICQ